MNNTPQSTREIKAFVKRASAAALKDWLFSFHKNGYQQGAYDMAISIEKEKQDGDQGVPSTTDTPDEGEVSSD
jgi:hypothetical protein